MTHNRSKLNGEMPDREGKEFAFELGRRMAAEGFRIFRPTDIVDIAEEMGLGREYQGEALRLFERQGWLVRVWYGAYAAPAAAGVAPLHEFEVAMYFAKPAAISHASAMYYHGLREERPSAVYVLSSRRNAAVAPSLKRKGEQEEGRPFPKFKLVKTKPKCFFGTEEARSGEGHALITDPERTLVDGLLRPKYCGGFGEVLKAFERRGGKLDVGKIVSYALRLEDVVAKRLGWVLEGLGHGGDEVEELRRVPVKGYLNLVSDLPPAGRTVSRWMLRLNVPEGERRKRGGSET